MLESVSKSVPVSVASSSARRRAQALGRKSASRLVAWQRRQSLSNPVKLPIRQAPARAFKLLSSWLGLCESAGLRPLDLARARLLCAANRPPRRQPAAGPSRKVSAPAPAARARGPRRVQVQARRGQTPSHGPGTGPRRPCHEVASPDRRLRRSGGAASAGRRNASLEVAGQREGGGVTHSGSGSARRELRT